MTKLRVTRSPLLWATAGLTGSMGIVLAAGGAWLAVLGGTWFHALAGLAMLAVAALLALGSATAWWAAFALVGATLVWSLWESGLYWWGLQVRGDLVFALGLFLLTPWVARAIAAREREGPALAPWTDGRRALALATGVFALVALATGFTDPFRREGALPQFAADSLELPGASRVRPEDWAAYGRTGAGQRYSPLRQITPDNVADLRLAWTFHTGDRRGHPGDPEETTFEVTPLKVGTRLFLCTPHQSVIALDATTGVELWRFQPRILDRLALQHLTCRGVSYHAGGTPHTAPAASAAAAATPTAATPAAAQRAALASAVSPSHAGSAPAGGEPIVLPVAAQGVRSIARCADKLYLPTADARIIALDPATGAVCRDFGGGSGQVSLWPGMPNARAGGYYSTSPVAVTARLVIVGGTVLDNVSTTEPSGVIRAFDADTGALLWNWDPAKPDDTRPIGPGQTYAQSTPNAWSIFSVDEALGMVYVPMGNEPPDQWGGRRSAAGERFGSSVVALDIATGELRWSFQTVHHDLWDYDVPSQPSLVDLTIGATTVHALAQPTKQGELFVLDRQTGRPVLPVIEMPAPKGAAAGDRAAPTQPVSALSFAPTPLTEADLWGATLFDQLWCRIELRRLRYEGRFTPPSLQGTLVHPGNFGVFNWGSIAVDPVRQVAFVTPAYLPFVSQLAPRPDATSHVVSGRQRPDDSLPALNENFGAPYAVKLHAFTSPLGLPCSQPPWGYVAGVHLPSGRIAWQHKNGTVRDLSPVPLPFEMGVPNLGGPIVTAGGVAFLTGTLDNYIRGYDLTDGRELWRERLPAGGQSTPMSYEGRDGRQYVVAVAGGHGSLGTRAGDAVIAYALPGRR